MSSLLFSSVLKSSFLFSFDVFSSLFFSSDVLSSVLISSFLFSSDFHAYGDHSQINYLRMQHRTASQELEFLCDGTVVYGSPTPDVDKIDYSRATAFRATALLAHNYRVIDLAAGERRPADEEFVDKLVYRDAIGRPDVSVLVEHDGCQSQRHGYREAGHGFSITVDAITSVGHDFSFSPFKPTSLQFIPTSYPGDASRDNSCWPLVIRTGGSHFTTFQFTHE
ncbi:unnamed protein product [Protopolystoma xenopodis]|uniref:Uncharacterized protein n=1 Tax=Protopolystoma xenopodis TaxID=117903 RepID=A0A448XHV4_9PLAT|nr:unnamed protein product [Protopolystoma xenopodis]